MDESLNWDFQINHVYSKLASANFAISTSKNFLPKKIRLTLYNSLFKSHLEFGILAWGGVKETQLKKITTLQKNASEILRERGIGHTLTHYSLHLTFLSSRTCSIIIVQHLCIITQQTSCQSHSKTYLNLQQYQTEPTAS